MPRHGQILTGRGLVLLAIDHYLVFAVASSIAGSFIAKLVPYFCHHPIPYLIGTNFKTIKGKLKRKDNENNIIKRDVVSNVGTGEVLNSIVPQFLVSEYVLEFGQCKRK